MLNKPKCISGFMGLMLVLCGAAFAQRSAVDSLNFLLKKRVAEHRIDSNLVNLHIRLAYSYNYLNPDSTIILAQQAVKLSIAAHYDKGNYVGLRIISLGYITKGDFITANAYIHQSLQLAEHFGDNEQIAACLYNIINIYMLQADYKEAPIAISQALKFYKQHPDVQFLVKILSIRAEMYQKQNQPDLALSDLFRILELSNKGALSGLFEQKGNEHVVAYTSNDIGNVYVKKGELQLAITFHKRALAYYERVRDDIGLIDTYGYLAKAYYLLKRPKEALYYGEKSYRLSKGKDMIRSLRDITGILYPIYYDKGMYKEAFQFQGLFKMYSDSLLNQTKIRELGRQEAKFEYDKEQISRRLAEIKKDAIVKQQSVRQSKIIFFSLIALMASLITTGVIYKSRKENIKTNHLLRLKNEEINEQAAALQFQANQLNELNNLKNRLFSIIAHDLRSPMVSFVQMLQLLNEDTVDAEDFKQMIPNLLQDVSYTSTLIENLLLWSKSQMNGFHPQPEPSDLFTMVENEIKLFEKQIYQKDIKLIDLIENPFIIQTDRNITELVLRNLIANAIKFTPLHGNITISAGIFDGFYQVAVKDTGCGLSDEAKSKLFSEENRTTLGTLNEKGSGLGLKLCKDFLEKMGGSIWVESEKGKGSTFSFSLPVLSS